MKNYKLAKRYVDAFVSIVKDQSDLDLIVLQFQNIKEIFSKELLTFMESPVISIRKKKEFLHDTLAAYQFNKQVIRMLTVLIENRRINVIFEFIELFEKEVNKYKGFKEVDVYTKYSLIQKHKDLIDSVFSKYLSAKVIIKEHVDPNIFGGFKIKIDNKIIDLSINGILKKLKLQLIAE